MSTRTLKLTLNQVAVVDDEDFDALSKFKWYTNPSHGHPYPARNIYKGTPTAVSMPREVASRMLGRPLTKTDRVENINNDRLDNRRENLRVYVRKAAAEPPPCVDFEKKLLSWESKESKKYAPDMHALEKPAPSRAARLCSSGKGQTFYAFSGTGVT